jgi:hypothetical protein
MADWVVFALLMGLTYVSHPLPLLALLLLIGAAVADELFEQADRSRFIRRFAWRVGPVFVVALIPLALLVAFGSSRDTDIAYYGSPIGRLARLLFDPVLALTGAEIPFAVMFAMAAGLLGFTALFHSGRSSGSSPGFLAAIGILFVVYFAAPKEIGEGSIIPSRVALYIMLSGLFWLATQSAPRWVMVTAVVLGVVAVVGITVVRIPVHADLNTDIREYVSGQAVVDPNSTVLAVWGVEPEGGGRVAPRHPNGYLMGDGELVDLGHFMGVLSISPVRFRDEFQMTEFLPPSNRRALILGPDLVDVGEFARRGPGRIDFIWLWDRAAAGVDVADEPAVERLFALLEDDYDLAFVSARGLLEVYERNPAG